MVTAVQIVWELAPLLVTMLLLIVCSGFFSASEAALFSLRATERARLKSGGKAVLDALPSLLREEPCTGLLHGTAYDTGYIEVISEMPPLGELRSQLKVETGSIRIR